MTKRRLLRWSLLLLILAAFAVWLEPTRIVWGWLRGEAFYEGRPTSYWEAELRHWHAEIVHVGSSLVGAAKPDEEKAANRNWSVVFARTTPDYLCWLRPWLLKPNPQQLEFRESGP